MRYWVGVPSAFAAASILTITDLSTSRTTVGMTWSAGPSAHTSSAALIVNGPAKTERRAHIACSAGVQRS